MKRYIKYSVVVGLLLALLPLQAQNDFGTSDDLGRIQLTSYVSNQIENLPIVARNNLQSKLARAVNKYGLGGSTNNARFIITPNISVLEKNVLATAPPRVVVVLDIGLFVGDGVSGTKFSSGSITAKGVGSNETKAYINAFKQLRPENKEFKNVIEAAKPKILEYYNTNCDFIVAEAQNQAAQNNFDMALLNLTTVPQVSKDCYSKVSALIPEYYQKKIDTECNLKLNNARNVWNTDQNLDGADKAGIILSSIDPNASCYRDAVRLSNDIGKRVKDLTDREWKYILNQQKLDAQVEKASLDTAQKVLTTYFENQPQTLNYNVRGWW